MNSLRMKIIDNQNAMYIKWFLAQLSFYIYNKIIKYITFNLQIKN